MLAKSRVPLQVLMCLAVLSSWYCPQIPAQDSKQPSGLALLVMDPMAAPLACDCVAGYAQRKYEFLGQFLSKQISQEVNVYWAESIKVGMQEAGRAPDIIIGKHSVVLHDAKQTRLDIRPLARLTDPKDSVVQTGLFVVRKDDPAQTMDQIAGYRILYGPQDCDEKSAAPKALLASHGVASAEDSEVAASCSEAAQALLKLPKDIKAAAVISSYAQPLLEGCGQIKKGDLRVVGESLPVPFITLFVRKDFSEKLIQQLSDALDEVGLDAKMLGYLETASGFVPWEPTLESHLHASGLAVAP